MIISRQNPRVKDMHRARKCKDGRALLEGPHLIAEAANAGIELESVLATPEFLAGSAADEILARLQRPPLEVAPPLLDELADSDSPRGVVALARLPRTGCAALPVREDGIYVYAEGLQDPGNLGALARVVEAAGGTALCLSPGTVHPNHPRALRASAGSLLRLPTAVRGTIDDLDERLAAISPRWVTLAPRGGEDLYARPLQGPLVLALGAEGQGLSGTVHERADLEITVPLAAPVESLNVTVAAAVVLFELRRRSLNPSAQI